MENAVCETSEIYLLRINFFLQGKGRGRDGEREGEREGVREEGLACEQGLLLPGLGGGLGGVGQ